MTERVQELRVLWDKAGQLVDLAREITITVTVLRARVDVADNADLDAALDTLAEAMPEETAILEALSKLSSAMA